MRCVTYNIAFGFNGNSFFANTRNHFYIHILQYPRLVKRQIRCVDDALNLVCGFSPDVLCLSEILPAMFGAKILERLQQEGYSSIVLDGEHHHKPQLQIATLLATKENVERIPLEFPHLEMAGSGGGACAMFVPTMNLSVAGVHLGIKRRFRENQVRTLKKFIAAQRDKGHKVIIMGDFNAGLDELHELGLTGSNTATNSYGCIPLGLAKDLDHIFFSQEYAIEKAEAYKGKSDHYLLYCELREQ